MNVRRFKQSEYLGIMMGLVDFIEGIRKGIFRGLKRMGVGLEVRE